MKIILITGPTSSGKTALAIKKAIQYNGELINADSRQVYKKLDIITGKDISKSSIFNFQYSVNNVFDIGHYIFKHESNKIKLWLYDVVDPKTYFSSFDFAVCARNVIKDIVKRGKTPIIVGGTYLYMHHLLYEVETEHIPPDFDLRNTLHNKDVAFLQKKVRTINPELFNSLNNSDKQNPQRLIRKIEIARYYKIKNKTQIPVSFSFTLHDFFKKAHIEFIGLTYPNREDLKHVITNRVHERIAHGAFEEVKHLLESGYTQYDPGLRTIGYTQIISYLNGILTKEQAIEEWILREFQYTKRQMTFMKRDHNIKWQISDVKF